MARSRPSCFAIRHSAFVIDPATINLRSSAKSAVPLPQAPNLNPQVSSLRSQASGLKTQASGLKTFPIKSILFPYKSKNTATRPYASSLGPRTNSTPFARSAA